MSVPVARPTCSRCLRPASACWCAELTPIPTRTRVVFLQHPRESRVAIGTARIAHLGLANSELHEGIDFSVHPRVRELIGQPGTALLFPGTGASCPDSLDQPPSHLLVIDGTWPQARKILATNPALRSLPRIGFVPRRPGNYRIRREPAQHCMATVEAVVEVLTAFEQAPDSSRFAPLLQAFDSMVDRQIAAKAARTEPVRRRLRTLDPWWQSAAMPDLAGWWPGLVAVAAEANSHRRDSEVSGRPEMIHLAAVRLATGAVFHQFIAPRRPLASGAPHHLGVPAEELLGGSAAEEAMTAWRRFTTPGDRLVSWGPFPIELLAQEGWSPELPPVDLRIVMAHRLKKRPGAPDTAAAALKATVPRFSSLAGRAGRTVEAVTGIVSTLRSEAAGSRAEV